MNCPKCNAKMETGYSSANTPLSWINEKKLESFVFKDKDLAESGFKNLFPWKGEYFQASNCSTCKIVVVDYSQKFDRNKIKNKEKNI